MMALNKHRAAFGYLARHLYFYKQKVWPGGTSYEYPGIAKPLTVGASVTDDYAESEQPTFDNLTSLRKKILSDCDFFDPCANN